MSTMLWCLWIPPKAMGCDGISPRLLKHCALPLCQPLLHLHTLSLSQHYVPLEWHIHLIKPIWKSGNKNSVENYRPISLLCITSKVLEKIVYNHLIHFVIKSMSIILVSLAFCGVDLLYSSYSFCFAILAIP